MTTDYLVFVHGVNTRDRDETYKNYQKLFDNICRSPQLQGKNFDLKPIYCFWGDVNVEQEKELVSTLQQSADFNRLWFKDFRKGDILRFVGDAALYISRYIGRRVADRLLYDALLELQKHSDDKCDRVHLITHSWGTVILFDILFAARWDRADIPQDQNSALKIRRSIFGLGDNPNEGVRLSSIHTMGSPISLFSLMDVIDASQGKQEMTVDEAKSIRGSTHDITPELQHLLEKIHQERQGRKMSWRNFIHPGDPIAYLLNPLMYNLVDGKKAFLDLQDVVVPTVGPLDFLAQLFNLTPVSAPFAALLNGGNAHSSYWRSNRVATDIASVIAQEGDVAQPPSQESVVLSR